MHGKIMNLQIGLRVFKLRLSKYPKVKSDLGGVPAGYYMYPDGRNMDPRYGGGGGGRGTSRFSTCCVFHGTCIYCSLKQVTHV